SMPGFLSHLGRGGRAALVISACAAVLIPLALEAARVIPPSVVLRDGQIVILPRMVDFPALPTQVVLGIIVIAPLVTMAIMLRRLRRERDAALRRVHLHLWRLRQLMPTPERDR